MPDMWIGLEVKDKTIKDIFKRLDAAKQEIIQCVNELDRLGITVTIGKEPPAATDDSEAE